MSQVLSLLEEKNRNLAKFYQMNEIEMTRIAEGNFDELENFYRNREGILDLIRTIDTLTEVASKETMDQDIDDNQRVQVMDLLDQKNELVTQILEQDLRILSLIEQAKSNIIKELGQVRLARKAISGYQSGTTKTQLDEEA